MQTFKAHFNGKTITVPKELHKTPPCDVLIITPSTGEGQEEAALWLKAQEGAFAKVWDNDEDAVYDSL